MKDAQARVQWVVDFMGQDLHQLRPGDWLNLRDDMWLFLWGYPLGQYEELRQAPFTEEEVRQFTPESFATVQQRARDMLHRIAQSNANRKNAPPEALLFGVEVSGKINRVFFDFSRPGPLRLRVTAEHLHDAFLFALGAALCAIDITDIRECPSCSTTFLAGHGRQLFCSSRCKTREASRRFRERHPDQVNAEARTRYERKVRTKLGPTQRVDRRKRKSQQQKEA